MSSKDTISSVGKLATMTLQSRSAFSPAIAETYPERDYLTPVLQHYLQLPLITFNRSNRYAHLDTFNSTFAAGTIDKVEVEAAFEIDYSSSKHNQGEPKPGEKLSERASQVVDEAAANYDRFIVVYSNGIKYMQCDKCPFICRPLVSIFSNHYRSHDENDSSEVLSDSRRSTLDASATYKDVIQCTMCGLVFENESLLAEHEKVHGARMFTCKVCNAKFVTKFELRSHRLVHPCKSTRPIRCNLCGKDFKTKSGYTNHRTNVCVKYKCDLCDEVFLVKALLLNHSKKMHNVEVVELSGRQKQVPSTSVCPICGKSISKTAINRHMQLHSEEKPYICDMCGKQFRVKWSLREHIMIEIGMKDFVCEICGKKFVIQAYLNKHMRFHMMCEGKLEGFQCEMCGKKYAEEWRVKEHQRNAHQNRSPPNYKCDVCDKKYPRKWLMRSHRRLTHKELYGQEYQCEHCDKKFIEKWMIRLHLRTLHNVRYRQQDKIEETALPMTDELDKLLQYNSAIKSELGGKEQREDDANEEMEMEGKKKSFECELCKKAFATKQGMKNHLYAELNLRKYACDICGKRYNWWMGLKEHSIMNHGEKEFVCGVCEKDFPTKKRFQDHMSVHSDSRPYECHCGNSFKLRRYLTKHQKRSCKMLKMTEAS